MFLQKRKELKKLREEATQDITLVRFYELLNKTDIKITRNIASNECVIAEILWQMVDSEDCQVIRNIVGNRKATESILQYCVKRHEFIRKYILKRNVEINENVLLYLSYLLVDKMTRENRTYVFWEEDNREDNRFRSINYSKDLRDYIEREHGRLKREFRETSQLVINHHLANEAVLRCFCGEREEGVVFYRDKFIEREVIIKLLKRERRFRN